MAYMKTLKEHYMENQVGKKKLELGPEISHWEEPPLEKAHRSRIGRPSQPDPFIHVKTLSGMRYALPVNWIVNWWECDDGKYLQFALRKGSYDFEGNKGTEVETYEADYDTVHKAVVEQRGSM